MGTATAVVGFTKKHFFHGKIIPDLQKLVKMIH